jgi:hypothetical protein
MKQLMLLLLVLSQSVLAQKDVTISTHVPAQAKTVEGFVPKGWKIEQKIEGDLNKDNIPDTVLELIQQSVPAEADPQRKLIIILPNKDKALHKAVVAEKLLLCPMCMGAMGTNADIRIEKGVLIVEHLTGSRETQDTLQRFRYDDKSGRFLLIGEDIVTNDRLTLDGSSQSSNYLTGEQVIETVKKDKVISKKKSKLPIKPVFIDEVNNQ